MTGRLVHDRSAVFRAMQMSAKKVFVFVEGIANDRYFYDQIIRSKLPERIHEIEFKTAKEIRSTNGGGKAILLDWFSELNESRRLASDFKGKKTAVVFILDKDIDDLEGKIVSSPHVIYTKYYDVENYHFVHGDIVKAAAAAASLPISEVEASIINSETWRKKAAKQWQDWVTVCIAAKKGRIMQHNYAHCSKVNVPIEGPVCQETLSIRLNELMTASGLTEAEFNFVLAEATKTVNDYYRKNRFDEIFKGKWYATLIEAEMCSRFRGGANTSGLAKKICSNLAQTVNYSGRWADHFAVPIGRAFGAQ